MTLTGPGCSVAVAELEVQTGVFRVEMGRFYWECGGRQITCRTRREFSFIFKIFWVLKNLSP